MEQVFESRAEASAAAAERIDIALQRRLASHERASVIVCGGTTPAATFDRLANKDIPWHRVDILLSDERWLPAIHQDSNEKLVRTHLLQNFATTANMLSVFAENVTPDERAGQLDQQVAELSNSYTIGLLGMGADGHFASLFPDADNLKAGIDMNSRRTYIPITTSASPYPRISMTLAALTASDELLLLFFGEEKRQIYRQARQRKNEYPVSHLLSQDHTEIDAFWAP